MANFAQFQDPSRPEGSAVQPRQMVQDNSTRNLTQGLTNTIGAIGNAVSAGQVTDTAKASRAYLKSQTQLVDQLATGQITEGEKQAKQRLNYQSALDAGVIPVDDLRSYTKDFFDVGDRKENMTQQQIQLETLVNDGVSKGMISAVASPAEQKQQAINYQAFLAQQERATAAQLDMNVTTQRKKFEQRKVLSEALPMYQEKFTSDAMGVLQDFKSGVIDEAGATAQLAQMENTVNSFITQLGPDVAEYGSTVVKPILDTFSVIKDQMSGKYTVEAANNKVKRVKALATADLFSNPKMAGLAVLSENFKQTDVLTATAMVNEVMSYITSLEFPEQTSRVPDLTDPDKKVAIVDTLDSLKTMSRSALDVNNPDQDAARVSTLTSLGSVVNSVATHGYQVTDSKDFNAVADFLGSPDIGKLISTTGGIPSDMAGDAQTVLEELYMDDVIQSAVTSLRDGELVNDFPELRSLGGDVNPSQSLTSDSIRMEFKNNGVKFVAAPKASAGVKARVNRLNKENAKLIDRLIRVDAHLNGNVDYQSSWENNIAPRFERIAIERKKLPAPVEQPENETGPSVERQIIDKGLEDASSVLERAGKAFDNLLGAKEKDATPDERAKTSRLPEEMIAKLQRIKDQNPDLTEAQMKAELGSMSITADRGVGVDLYAAIENLYKKG